MGRVEIVILRVGVRAKEGEGGGGLSPFSPLLGSFNMALLRAKPFARQMKMPALQARPNHVLKYYREEKSLHHIGMVSKFLCPNKPWSCKIWQKNDLSVYDCRDKAVA